MKETIREAFPPVPLGKAAKELRRVQAVMGGGATSSGYTDSIVIKKPFLILEGDAVGIDWDSVEDWAQEVAARTLFDYLNPDPE